MSVRFRLVPGRMLIPQVMKTAPCAGNGGRMDAAIATYAAVVATVALVWQIGTQVKAHRPRLRVEGLLTFYADSREAADALADGMIRNAWAPDTEFKMQVDVTNVGQSSVIVQRVEFKQRVDHGMRTWVIDSDEDGRALRLEAGEFRQFMLTDDQIDNFDPRISLAAEITLGTGRSFVSEEFGTPVKGTALVMMRRKLLEEMTGGLDEDRFYIHEVNLPAPPRLAQEPHEGK